MAQAGGSSPPAIGSTAAGGVSLYDEGTMRPWIVLLAALVTSTIACSDDSPAGGGRATVVGTLTLPAATIGRPYSVRILTAAGSPTVAPVREATGTTANTTTLPYSIADVPAGTYFILAFVDVDASGGQSSTPGDQAGWYGHTGDGNPPPNPNAAVPPAGTVRFDFSLVVR